MDLELKDGDHILVKQDFADERQRIADRDEELLARFGKKQQLRRRFSLLPAIGLTSTLMITWEGITVTLVNGLENGGPAGLIYGYLFVWAGALTVTVVMAELASAIPLAGGPFNWVAIMAPTWCRKYLSYLAGWLTLTAYMALVAATCWVTGTIIQGLLVLNYPDTYVFHNWHGTLLFYAVLTLALFVNTYLGRILPQIESLLLLFHILGFFAILIPLAYLAPHQPAKEVFTTFTNSGEWSSMGLAFFVGLLTCSNCFPGVDAADHIAEEVHDASRVIPIAICTSTMLNGSLGFAMMVLLMFCMPTDIASIINTETEYPFIAIYRYALNSDEGATALISVIVCAQVCGAIGMLATASRMVWAFAREGGLPFSRYLSRVDEKTRLPVWAIGATAFINVLLALINIGSTAGFLAFASLLVAGYFSSFILTASIMLHKRLTTPESEIPYGWFRLGRAGVPITIVALCFATVVTFFSMWPMSINPTLKEMNWCVLVYGATLIFSVIFWFVHGKQRYTGPVMEI